MLDFLPSLWNLANVKKTIDRIVFFSNMFSSCPLCKIGVVQPMSLAHWISKCLGMESNEMNNDLGFKIASKWRKFEDNNGTN